MNEFRLATPADGPELSQLCSLPIPGDWLDLSYRRHPKFFDSLSCPTEQVLIGRYQGQALAAMALRANHPVYYAGQASQVGYLGGLRVDPRHQGRYLLWQGFALLSKLEQQDPYQEYLATVVEGNQMALQLLVQRPRPHRPKFFEAGRLLTFALEVPRISKTTSKTTVLAGQLSPSSQPVPPELLGQLSELGKRQDYFPSQYPLVAGEERHWICGQGVVGAVRLLSATRQTVVAGYHGLLGRARPYWNAWAKWRGRPQLPAIGEPLKGAYLGFLAREPRAHLDAWLDQALAVAANLGVSWLYLGLYEHDNAVTHVSQRPHRLYCSNIYKVCCGVRPRLGQPYLELAWL